MRVALSATDPTIRRPVHLAPNDPVIGSGNAGNGGGSGRQWPYRSGTSSGASSGSAGSAGTTAAPAGYQPSSDDSYIYEAIAVTAPYTQAELTFAQAVEALGSPVSSYFTQEEIQAAYTAYQGNGNSVATAQQSLQQSLAAITAAQQSAAGLSSGTVASTATSFSLTDWLLLALGGAAIYMVARK